MAVKTLRVCRKGHKYYKSSDCPVCPVCANEDKAANGFLSSLSAPAGRALTNAGITKVKQLSKFTEADIMKLHGMGPASLPKLKETLKEKRLSFKKTKA